MQREYASFQEFWREVVEGYGGMSAGGYVLIHFIHINDQLYASKRTDPTFRYSYQPLIITFANPYTREVFDVFVREVRDADVVKLREWYGAVYPPALLQPPPPTVEKHEYDQEFSSWEDFVREWLFLEDGASIFATNVPIRLDHISDSLYADLRAKGKDACGYQRLIITIAQYKTKAMADVFIRDVDDAVYNLIHAQMGQLVAQYQGTLFNV